MITNQPPIVVQQDFNVPASVLWNSITNQEQMIKWFFSEIKEFKPEIGFKTEFNVNTGERDFLHQWKVTELQDREKITYRWEYEGVEASSFVRFEVFDLKGKSSLKVSHFGWENFPQEISEFQKENCLGGWEYFIQDSLPKFLQ